MKTVISGSYQKFLPQIGEILENFNSAKIKVLSPLSKDVIKKKKGFVFLSTDNLEKTAGDIEKEFMSNIKKSDFMYLANIGGYVGESSATEMCVAIINGTPIVANTKIKVFSDKVPVNVRNILKKSIFAELSTNKIDVKNIKEINLKKFNYIKLSVEDKIILLNLIEKLIVNLNKIKGNSGNLKSNLYLKPNPVLTDFQKYVKDMVSERGFYKESASDIFMLFLEECGEMAKAARKYEKLKIDKNSEIFSLENEIADVFIYLLDICNYYDIDLEKSFRDKEEINKKRNWS